MHKIKILCLMLSLAIWSCGEEEIHVEEDTDAILQVDSTGQANANITHQANFVSDAHPTSGNAQVVMDEDGKKILVFTDFKTDPGPDLDVYLSTQKNTKDFINLGDLKGNSGQFSYDLPQNIDIAQHPYVMIWCVQFSVNFGYAKLE